ncbi:MAG: hypothetical protein RBT13_08420, partial [Bacteroidales bacterium]|nr:hypothetical protein [Bacteroidales bacterium]
MKKLIVCLCVCCSMLSMAQQKVTEEKLLQIMQTELNRNMQRLQNEEVPVYLLSYRIDDQQEHAIASSFGA